MMRVFIKNFASIAFALTWMASVAVRADQLVESGRPTGNKKERAAYRPVHPEIWLHVGDLIAKNKAAEVLEMSVSKTARQSEKDELNLEITKALLALKQPIHAQYLLTRIANVSIGTRQGDEALYMLSQVAKNNPVDEMGLEDLMFDLDSSIDDPETRSFVNYFRARALRRKGYDQWASDSLAQIDPDSTWGKEVQWDRTLQLLNTGDVGASYPRFEALSRDPAARTATQKLAQLALARLIFERKDYKSAIATYLTIDVPTRERARSLNELAWSYYYDRAYGRALGVIQALRSPYYRDLFSPETDVLEMLIYRELCHYDVVKGLANNFLARYKTLFGTMEARKPLEHSIEILQMALQEGVLQHRAGAIQEIHLERPTFAKNPWGDEVLHKGLLDYAQKRERIIDAEITRQIRSRIDGLANWFLGLREQVWFLQYESSMRMIQLNEEDPEHYAPPQASHGGPQQFFWPVGAEAWNDELLDYETLVQDACSAGPKMPPKPPGTGGAK